LVKLLGELFSYFFNKSDDTPKGVIQTQHSFIESAELLGTVKVGAESAKRLSKKLGRKVEVGEEFDLGTLAYFNRDPEKQKQGFKKIHKNIFNN